MALTALVFAAPAQAGGPRMLLGAVADNAVSLSLPETISRVDLLHLAGFDAIRVTLFWQPGQRAPTEDDLLLVRNAGTAAQLQMELYVTVTNQFGRTAPNTEADRADFAAYAASLVRQVDTIDYLIVGNEPNLARFWLPQFNPDSTGAAPAAYEALLAETYDAVKAVSPKQAVLGGAVSPRGNSSSTVTAM